jgi:hypothetical protein
LIEKKTIQKQGVTLIKHKLENTIG